MDEYKDFLNMYLYGPPIDKKDRSWIGVDLDGTLAEYHGWKGPKHIGKPIQPMVDRVLAWLAEGKQVKIFTARAAEEENIPVIHDWLESNGLPFLEVTNQKDYCMDELWDDRCVQVERNTGHRMYEPKEGQYRTTWAPIIMSHVYGLDLAMVGSEKTVIIMARKEEDDLYHIYRVDSSVNAICHKCEGHGKGFIGNVPCPECGGTGKSRYPEVEA